MMKDRICGKVINVVDGDTFDIYVTRQAPTNRYPYNRDERIRLRRFDAPELGTRAGQAAKRQLERCLAARTICFPVSARDVYRRLVCDVRPDCRP